MCKMLPHLQITAACNAFQDMISRMNAHNGGSTDLWLFPPGKWHTARWPRFCTLSKHHIVLLSTCMLPYAPSNPVLDTLCCKIWDILIMWVCHAWYTVNKSHLVRHMSIYQLIPLHSFLVHLPAIVKWATPSTSFLWRAYPTFITTDTTTVNNDMITVLSFVHFCWHYYLVRVLSWSRLTTSYAR